MTASNTSASAAIAYDGGLTCSLQTADLQRSIDWYIEKLGFELIYRMDEMGWCELKSPVDRVAVGLSQVETVSDVRGGATMTFGVKDIDAARATLEKQDIRFDGDTITIDGMVRLATFFDPDGNALMFYQDLSAQQDEVKS